MVSKLTPCLLVGLVLWGASSANATWSITMADCETKEVAVGTVTCLNNFDLVALVPVVVVGKGTGACQSAGDFDGIRRPVIFDGLVAGTAPADILTELALITGHNSRQYGIADTNDLTVTFTGPGSGNWKGGLTGSQGTMVYAIQGNVLAGDCVVPAIEDAILNTAGDMAQKLMAGMKAAQAAGGDGRCSCLPSFPTVCGCPPDNFDKSGHIGGVIVARVGDTDDPLCNVSGCADGDYFLRLNVAFQPSGNPDPVIQLQALFSDWRAALVGRPDAIQSMVGFSRSVIPPNGVSTTTMTITLLDWQGLPVTAPIQSVTVQHASDSAGLSSIGPVTEGAGTFTVELTSGTSPGIDRFVVTADDGIRPVLLAPNSTYEYFTAGDIDGNGVVDVVDLLALLGTWGACPSPPAPCPGDLDGDGMVGVTDLLILLANWTI